MAVQVIDGLASGTWGARFIAVIVLVVAALLPATATAAEIGKGKVDIAPLAGPVAEADEAAMLDPRLDCKLIDFRTAELQRRGLDTVLVLAGESPYAPDEVALLPVMYVMMPEYWQITVVGCRRSAGAATVASKSVPYAVERPVGGALGRKGVRVMGLRNQIWLALPN